MDTEMVMERGDKEVSRKMKEQWLRISIYYNRDNRSFFQSIYCKPNKNNKNEKIKNGLVKGKENIRNISYMRKTVEKLRIEKYITWRKYYNLL